MKKYIGSFALVLMTYTLSAQEYSSSLSYQNYMQKVQSSNIAYAAEKYNIAIADAETQSAYVFEDPEVNLEYFDNGEAKNQMGYGFAAGLGWTLELGGKRKARINLAKSEAELTKILLRDYFRNLQADATLDYLQALHHQKMLQLKQESYQMIRKLAESDSIRFRLGEISQVDADQSLLEARSMLNEIFQAEAEANAATDGLFLWMGNENWEDEMAVSGEFHSFTRQFLLEDLVRKAQENRTDLMAALQSKEISQKNIALAKANRAIDLGLSVGIEHNAEVRNLDAGSPKFTQINGGITIPLKFSNRRNNELNIAQIEKQQVEKAYDQLALEIKTQVQQAYRLYQGLAKQVQQFDANLLQEAQRILEAKTYSYQRGNTSLLEVLDAQRTYNELQENYLETMLNYAEALVELERAVGIWDIDF